MESGGLIMTWSSALRPETISIWLPKSCPGVVGHSERQHEIVVGDAIEDRSRGRPVVRMEFRLAELENPARQHRVRLGQVAMRQNSVDELKRASIVMRAESYRRRLFSEFDRAKERFLP
jgi:hypothetical protein